MAQRDNCINPNAALVLETIDSCMIDKMALACPFKGNSKNTFLSLTGPKRREEGMKKILKSHLVSTDQENFRVRLQTNGGFSISMSSPAFDMISTLHRNYRLQNFYYTALLEGAILPEDDKEEFLENWNKIFQRRASSKFYILGKETTLYMRSQGFGVGYRRRDYYPLYASIISAFDFVSACRYVGQKILAAQELLTASNISPNQNLSSEMVFVSSDYILAQMNEF